MTQTRYVGVVSALLTLMYLGCMSVGGCTAGGVYRMLESTRVYSIEVEGVIHAYKEEDRNVLLPRVPFPSPEGRRSVPEEKADQAQPHDVRGDGTSPQKGEAGGASVEPSDDAAECDGARLWEPMLVAVPCSNGRYMFVGCRRVVDGECAHPRCVSGQLAADYMRKLSTPRAVVRTHVVKG